MNKLSEINRPGELRTHTGLYLNFIFPKTDQIDLVDIAVGLARQARWAGQNKFFYSVTIHSMRVASELFSKYHDYDLALQGLLHDASEAYLGDIPGTLKPYLTEYKEYEKRLQATICEKFDISFPFDPRVKEVDKEQLVWEWENTVIDDCSKKIKAIANLKEQDLVDEFISEFQKYYNGRLANQKKVS